MEFDEERIRRFWSRVDKNGPIPPNCPELGPCWVWIGATNSQGYGSIKINKKRSGAHRISFILKNGPVPDGLWVLHKCSNKSCVNPLHLYIGTIIDNAKDAILNGELRPPTGDRHYTKLTPEKIRRGAECWSWGSHHTAGENHGMAKLTNKQVETMRFLFKEGKTRKELAKDFDVSYVTACEIVGWRTWKTIQQ